MKARLAGTRSFAFLVSVSVSSIAQAQEEPSGSSEPAEEPASDSEEEGGDDFGFDDDFGASASGAAAIDAGPGPSPLDVLVGVGAVGRDLHFVDTGADLSIDSDAPVRDGTMDATAAAQIAARWYPMAHFSKGALAHIGLSAAYARGLSDKVSYDLDGQSVRYNQTYQSYSVGLRGRIPISMLTLGVEANYGSQALWVRAKDGANPFVFPDVNYSYVEGRLDARLQINQVSLTAYGGYLYVLGLGEIADSDWFANAKAMAIHYGAEVGYQFDESWELVGGLDARSYRLNFNPLDAETAPRIAGGASDQYVSFWAGVRFTMPGAGSKASSASATPAEEAPDSDMDGFDSFD